MPTATEDKGVAERSMGLGLRWLNKLAGSDLLDRIRIRKQVERALFTGTKNGFRSATAAGRTFKAAQNLTGPARQKPSKPRALFDISPDDEQQMLQEGVRDFAEAKVRPVAKQADFDKSTPSELLEPGQRARHQHARRPRGARRRHARAGRGDQRPDRRGPRPRRHGHRLRGARPRRRRHRDRPLGHARAGGDLPARLHRRGHAGGGAGDSRAAAAVRSAEAGDDGDQEG